LRALSSNSDLRNHLSIALLRLTDDNCILLLEALARNSVSMSRGYAT
jgi:hypothetical protein